MNKYTTVTAKGQITLPASLRKQLRITEGTKVRVSRGPGNQIIIDAPPTVDVVRERFASELAVNGFSADELRAMAHGYQNGEGLQARARGRYGR